MAQIPYRANTQTSLFPLLSQFAAQTIIEQNGIDATYVRGINPAEAAAPGDFGIPQVMYGHNIMPSTYGFQSVGYLNQYPAWSGGGSVNFESAELVITTDRIRTYVAPDYRASGRLYLLSQSGVWRIPTGSPSGLTLNNRISIATINGVSYICVARVGTYTYTHSSNTLTKVTLKGLSDSAVLGLVSASGYLIAWSRTGVTWSSTNDPLDFEPSDISGAGGGDVQEARGDLVYAVKTAYGFIIYTTNNAVSVTYSGNSNFPFNFREISAAGGIASGEMVSIESVGTQYAYTTNGMQQLFHTGAKTTLAYITDFLAGQIFEDFDPATQKFTISTFSTTMRKKLTLIADRYLVISYGISQTAQMTHAIVVDIVQTRMGKLKIQHNSCFELRNINPEVTETPRRSIAFLQADGSVKVVDFNTENQNSNGVILYGKFQIARTNETGLEKIQVENIPGAAQTVVMDLLSYDGKNFQRSDPGILSPDESEGYLNTYLFHNEAKSHTIMISGAFNVNMLLLWFVAGGNMT